MSDAIPGNERRLTFSKTADAFDNTCADRLVALTIDRHTPGIFLPPLNLGETAILNMLRIRMPVELFLATSPFGSGRDAMPELMKARQHSARLGYSKATLHFLLRSSQLRHDCHRGS